MRRLYATPWRLCAGAGPGLAFASLSRAIVASLLAQHAAGNHAVFHRPCAMFVVCVTVTRPSRTRCLVSLGTDGQDGPTDAAGACVDGKTWERGLDAKLDPLDFLHRFDSYSFFDREGGLVRLGKGFRVEASV